MLYNQDTRDAIVQAIVDRIDSGTGNGQLIVYKAPQPSPDAASSATELSRTTFAKPSFSKQSTGAWTIAPGATDSFVTSGVAKWFRIVDSSGNFVLDGTIGLDRSGADLIVNTLNVTTSFTILSLAITQPA
jgi:hypothetical protein